MKVWYHVIAAIVGIALAALIVYMVFGNASQEGAVQDGEAPSTLDQRGAQLCGTIPTSELTTAATRKLARDNPPALATADGPISSISEDKPDQQAWIDRVHAASGLCADEIQITQGMTTISMSAADGVSPAELGTYGAQVLNQAFTAPFNPLGCPSCHVKLIVSTGGSERTTVVGTRAWRAFQFARRTRKQPLTMHALAQFKRATSFRPADLTVTGW